MFLGHFALGLMAKAVAPRQNEGVLIAAPGFMDIVWPTLILAGIEHARVVPGNTAIQPLVLEEMPWSHSLLMSLVWSALFGLGVWLFTRDVRGTWVSGGLVFSHWVLDWVTHPPDLQLVPWNSYRVGVGLWHSLWGTLVVELVLFAAGCWVYLRATRPTRRIGRVGPPLYMGFLLLAYLASVFGPPPPSAKAAALGVVVLLATLPFVAWFDRCRVAVGQRPGP